MWLICVIVLNLIVSINITWRSKQEEITPLLSSSTPSFLPPFPPFPPLTFRGVLQHQGFQLGPLCVEPLHQFVGIHRVGQVSLWVWGGQSGQSVQFVGPAMKQTGKMLGSLPLIYVIMCNHRVRLLSPPPVIFPSIISPPLTVIFNWGGADSKLENHQSNLSNWV